MLFWNTKYTSIYEVPKGSGKMSNFASDIWIGGFDVNHKLHFAGETYDSAREDYFCGPMMDSVYYKDNVQKWKRLWKINKSTIDSFKLYWNKPGYKIPRTISDWPRNGNTALGESRKLAPYYDNDNDQTYDPTKGDYPIIRGDQAVYFIINDDSIHTASGGEKLGIEIHGMVWYMRMIHH